MSVIKQFKKGRKIICYITEHSGKFTVCTGKPSDISCVGWTYDNMGDAETTASEFFNNYTNVKITII